MERIGIIGLGRMGSAIAQRMAAQGYSVQGWTRSGRSVDGVQGAPDLASLVAGSDCLILSLYDDAAVAEMLDALLALDLAGKQIIETSTVLPALLQDRITAIGAAGASAVDAPISGGPELVLAGACGVFIGGADAAAARAQAVLADLTPRIFHVGPLGAGLVMKVINNAMMQHYFNGLAEMLPLARKAGLSLETALGIVNGGPAGIAMIRDRMPKVLGEDDSVGFNIAGIMKDNDVFQRVLHGHGLPSKMLEIFADHGRAAQAAGYGQKDAAAFINFVYDRDQTAGLD